jgi:hypothetical protein
MSISPQWHDECRRMRSGGMSAYAIAKHFGKSSFAVRYILNEHGEREAKRARSARYRNQASHRSAQHDREAIRPSLISEAVDAFRAGQIDMVELDRRIRG